MTNTNRYFKHFEDEVLPSIEKSAFVFAIASEKPDAKMCLEIGAAVLLDKPIIIIIHDGVTVPANLKRLSASIVEMTGNVSDVANRDKLNVAMSSLIKNDIRAKSQRD